MTNRMLCCLKRWFDIVAYGVLGSIFLTYVGPHWSTFITERFIFLFGTLVLAKLILLVIGIALLVWLNIISGTRLKHAKNLLTYPPLPISLILSFIVGPLLPTIPSGALATGRLPWDLAEFSLGLFIAMWLIQTSFLELLEGLASTDINPLKSPEAPIQKRKLSDTDLKEWLKRESPIENEEWDMFDHAAVATRLVERLGRGESTMALQGPFGSGKSSLVAMARQVAKRKDKRLIFAQVSCWGFDDAARAQEEILRELLVEIAKEIDCVAIKNIPSEYVEAISEHAGWLKSFAKIGFSSRSPLQQLQRLSPLLVATDHQAVICIEDVDRNGKDFDISKIQALLVQFREVKGISFVLSISPNQQIDFARLCDYIEVIPAIQPHDVLQLIHQTRELLLRENPIPVLLDKFEPLIAEDGDYSPLYAYVGYHWSMALSLSYLLRTPRYLKHVLRRVSDAWPRLYGEVRIDDLINAATLRTVAPEAFSFFVSNWQLCRSFSQQGVFPSQDNGKNELREELKTKWEKVCVTADFNTRAASWLMKEIFPSTGAVTGVSGVHTQRLQSMQSKPRGEVYARRLITESLAPNEPKDQTILTVLERAKKDRTDLLNLAHMITDSKAASDTFEEFSPRLDFNDHLLPLLTEVYALIRRECGQKINVDEHPGFFAPWRLVGRGNRPSNFTHWLADELKKCVPNHLRLLTEIYYFWLGDKHSFEERLLPRQSVFEAIRTAWTQTSPDSMSLGFDGDYLYTLFHLVFTSDYERPETVPCGKAEDWSWLGPVLLNAAESNPEIIVPQVITALNSIRPGGFTQPKFAFNESVLQAWFGVHKRDFFQLVAHGFPIRAAISAQSKYTLNDAVEKAKLWLVKDGHTSSEATLLTENPLQP